MRVGFAKAVITPETSSQLAGYSQRKFSATGVLDPLFVKVLLLDGITLVVYDLIGIAEPLMRRLEAVLAEPIVVATHTHAGPLLTPDYIDFLVEITLQAVKHAKLGQLESSLSFGVSKITGVGANRISPEFSGGAEALFIETAVCNLIVYGCHPTVLGPDNTLYSADLTGAITRHVTERTGVETLVLPGALGDVSTRFTRRAQNASELERLGKVFAEQLSFCLRPIKVLPKVSKSQLELSQRHDPPQDILDATAKHFLDEGRSVVTGEPLGTTELQAELILLTLGDLTLFFCPFEIQNPTLELLRHRITSVASETWIVSCTGAYYGYLPTDSPGHLNGYEASVAQVPLSTEATVIAEVERMLTV